MKQKNIHNIDTLEKEIYRLQLEAKNIETKLDDNFERLQKNYSSLIMNSLFCKKKNNEDKNGFVDALFNNQSFDDAINRIKNHVADRTAESIESLIDRLFHKKNK